MLSVIQGAVGYQLEGGGFAISNTRGCWLSVMGEGGAISNTRGCWLSVMDGVCVGGCY